MFGFARIRNAALVLSFQMLLGTLIVVMPGPVLSTAPEIAEIVVTPTEPKVSDALNVSVTFDVHDEPLIDVKLQSCVNDICDLPVDMTGDGSGSHFWKQYLPFRFENATVVFDVFADYGYGLNPIGGPFNVTIRAIPTRLVLDASLDRTVTFPGQMFVVNGSVKNDLDEDVPGADVNLSVKDDHVWNMTSTDLSGNFSIGISIPTAGEYVLNLSIDADGLRGYAEWDVSVNQWTIPQMGITGEDIFSPGGKPPGETGNIFYADTSLSVRYWVRNTGNDDAYNTSALITVQNSTLEENVSIGTLEPSQTYEGNMALNTSAPGNYSLIATVHWDQTAPRNISSNTPQWQYSYSIVPLPVWTGHTVLVEMFTQTTCGPCVYVEEALERLYDEGELDFEYMLYVMDDEVSALKGAEMGVTSTPDVFIDDGFDRMTGGGGLNETRDDLARMIMNASKRETPPVVISFTDTMSGIDVSVGLRSDYTGTVTGLLQVYEVEASSNVRNLQGVPMSHRFMGPLGGLEIDGLGPGASDNLTVGPLQASRTLLAVLLDQEEMVIQSAYRAIEGKPSVYLKVQQEIVRMKTPGSVMLNLTLETFRYDTEGFGYLPYALSCDDLPDNWTLSSGGIASIGASEAGFNLSYSAFSVEMLPVGRVRYSSVVHLELSVPDNDSGAFDFTVRVRSGGSAFETKFIVLATPKDNGDNVTPTPSILDFYLEGDGQNIFFYVEAKDVPAGAIVKGRVIPCDLEDAGLCGVPVEMVLAWWSGDLYRASVLGADLETYTHLTYSAWIEDDGVKLNYTQTEERKVEIAWLIDIADDDGSDGMDALMMAIYVVSFLMVLLLVMAVLIFVLKGRSEKGKVPEGTSSDVPAEGKPAEEAGDIEGAPKDGDVPPESGGQTAHQQAQDAPGPATGPLQEGVQQETEPPAAGKAAKPSIAGAALADGPGPK